MSEPPVGCHPGPVDERDGWHFDAELWLWKVNSTWVFLTVPSEVSDQIDEIAIPGGWGSVKVEAMIGTTTWRTSVFPSKELAAFILPVKKAVRTAQGLEIGDRVEVHLRLG